MGEAEQYLQQFGKPNTPEGWEALLSACSKDMQSIPVMPDMVEAALIFQREALDSEQAGAITKGVQDEMKSTNSTITRALLTPGVSSALSSISSAHLRLIQAAGKEHITQDEMLSLVVQGLQFAFVAGGLVTQSLTEMERILNGE